MQSLRSDYNLSLCFPRDWQFWCEPRLMCYPNSGIITSIFIFLLIFGPAPCCLLLPFPSVSHTLFFFFCYLHFRLLHFYAWGPEARRYKTPLWRRVVLLCLIFLLLGKKYKCCLEVVSKISVLVSPSIYNGCILLWFSIDSTKKAHSDLPTALTGGKL